LSAAQASVPRAALAVAAALALATAVSLGLGRFSYALLLPPMRADLGWSYLTAGAMNTANAAGYLLGALLLPRALARFDARRVLLAGSMATALLLAAHGLVLADAALLLLRTLAGAASAAAFVAGALLAARLASRAAPGVGAGLVLGIYYGGTGIGIIASALLVPPLAGQPAAHAWQSAWFALALAALAATAVVARATRGLDAAQDASAERAAAPWTPFAFALAGYLMFGLGYIGYMTFVVTLLHELQSSARLIVGFYIVLGLGVIGSSWLWAGLLQRSRGGGALALLNALLALATLLPVLSAHPVAVFASGALFGAVFLSVVAATTAYVRHNLAPAAWASGISAFTIVFAAGQIVGPGLTGWVADAAGGGVSGLTRGLAISAAVLGVGAVLASRQKPLA
jgi:predicted MFS family arabinose efflux permease